MVPMPLDGIFEPRDVAYLLDCLASQENAHLRGPVIFIDADRMPSSEATLRGDDLGHMREDRPVGRSSRIRR